MTPSVAAAPSIRSLVARLGAPFAALTIMASCAAPGLAMAQDAATTGHRLEAGRDPKEAPRPAGG